MSERPPSTLEVEYRAQAGAPSTKDMLPVVSSPAQCKEEVPDLVCSGREEENLCASMEPTR
eukprot:258349-Hanusia_phi.AAC.1